METLIRTTTALPERPGSTITLAPDRTTGIALHGTRYDFIVEAAPSNEHFSFDLRAIDRHSGRWSSVATVNSIMAELLGDAHHPTENCWWYTPWDVPADECARLLTAAVHVLIDQHSLERIESALDRDRASGAWRAN